MKNIKKELNKSAFFKDLDGENKYVLSSIGKVSQSSDINFIECSFLVVSQNCSSYKRLISEEILGSKKITLPVEASCFLFLGMVIYRSKIQHLPKKYLEPVSIHLLTSKFKTSSLADLMDFDKMFWKKRLYDNKHFIIKEHFGIPCMVLDSFEIRQKIKFYSNVSKVIIPIFEIIRFYFFDSSNLIRAIINDGLNNNENKLFCFDGKGIEIIDDKRCGDVKLGKNLLDKDAITVARIKYNDRLNQVVKNIYQNLQQNIRNRTPAYLTLDYSPFPENVNLKALGKKFTTNEGEDAIYIYQILKSNEPLEFDQLIFNRENDNLKEEDADKDKLEEKNSIPQKKPRNDTPPKNINHDGYSDTSIAASLISIFNDKYEKKVRIIRKPKENQKTISVEPKEIITNEDFEDGSLNPSSGETGDRKVNISTTDDVKDDENNKEEFDLKGHFEYFDNVLKAVRSSIECTISYIQLTKTVTSDYDVNIEVGDKFSLLPYQRFQEKRLINLCKKDYGKKKGSNRKIWRKNRVIAIANIKFKGQNYYLLEFEPRYTKPNNLFLYFSVDYREISEKSLINLLVVMIEKGTKPSTLKRHFKNYCIESFKHSSKLSSKEFSEKILRAIKS